MQRAIALGSLGRLTAPPNPWVGCVLVRDGEVVGEGFHQAPGGAHAEVNALAQAGERARGATAYVPLEPCSHHGRTPPCTEALMAAGVTRVVAALIDPDERVGGTGVRVLREHGVEVAVGVGNEEARESLAPYLFHRMTGRAWCVLKSAISIDGRIAATDGTSRWITGEPARADSHRLRAESQAVLVGSGTALEDRPALTVRHLEPPAGRQPLRVLLDARGRVPANGPLFDTSLAPTLVVTTGAADPKVRAAWSEVGAEVVEVSEGAEGRGIDLEATLEILGARDVLQVLVEGGAALNGALLRTGLANRLVVYVGSKILGAQGHPLVGGPGPATMEDAFPFQLLNATKLGDDVRLEYEYGKVVA